MVECLPIDAEVPGSIIGSGCDVSCPVNTYSLPECNNEIQLLNHLS